MAKQSLRIQEEMSFRHALADIGERKTPPGFDLLQVEDLVRITRESVKSALRDSIRANHVETAFTRIDNVVSFLDAQLSTSEGREFKRSRRLVEKSGIALFPLVRDGTRGKIVREVMAELHLSKKGRKMVGDAFTKKIREFERASTVNGSLSKRGLLDTSQYQTSFGCPYDTSLFA